MKNDVRRPTREEDAMTTTQRYLPGNRRQFRPLIGLAAIAATCATLALAVVTPAALPHAESDRVAQPAAQRVPAATEVAISPASIEVVGKRVTRAARGASPYLPATYRSRG